MQYACAILSTVACPNVQYFPPLPVNRHDSRKKILNIKGVFRFSLQILSEIFFFHFLKNWARYDQKSILVLI